MIAWIKKILLFIFFLPVSLFSKEKKDKDKNIVLFIVDDMGWQDTSVPFDDSPSYFNTIYETPNMEHLSKIGVKFTSAYTTAVSSPSRVSLFTGMNAVNHRVTNWTLHYNTTTDEPDEQLEFPKWNVNGIQNQDTIPNSAYVTMLPELLHQKNYYNIHVGKAHFGAISTPSANPVNMGFDVNIAGSASGSPASYYAKDNFGNHTDGTKSSPNAVVGLEKYWGKDLFLTEILTKEAINVLDNRPKNKPFFLYMSHYAIHTPIQKDERFYQKYKDKGLSDMEASYASLIEGMDKSLGDIISYLHTNNLMDDTIILFVSDNGGLSSHTRTLPKNCANRPLSCGKGSLREGGVRVPMMVYWKGRAEAGTKISQDVIIEDFFPTILDMAGLNDYSTIQKIDGESFVPLLDGYKTDKKRTFVWNYPHKWSFYEGEGFGPATSIKYGDYKLIYYYRTGKKELFNIKEDLGETNNLASSQKDLLERMSKMLREELISRKAQLPIIKKTGQPCPLP